jgi:hypothetical protein
VGHFDRDHGRGIVAPLDHGRGNVAPLDLKLQMRLAMS